jgi:hypothetical protein
VTRSACARDRDRRSRARRARRADLAIAGIAASWSLAGLRERRLDSLRVSGVELRTQREGQLSLGALDALFAGDASPDAAPSLPASEIAIEAARVRIETPQGVATGTLGGSVQSATDGTIDGEFELALDGAGLRARGALEVSGSLDAPAFHALLEAEPGLPIAGRVEVRGLIEREQGERVFDATVALRDASFTSDIMRISGVNGVSRCAARRCTRRRSRSSRWVWSTSACR